MRVFKVKLVVRYFASIPLVLFLINLFISTPIKAQLGTGGCGDEEVESAIGCVPIGGTGNFIGFLLPWGIGIAGGVAFILIIYAGFMVITSAGNPQRLQAGKELLTAAVMGLILLIFGVFILEFIGVDILNIPGFGR